MRFRVANRYTGSDDVLGGGVTAEVLLFNYGVVPVEGQRQLHTLDVGESIGARASKPDGKLTGDPAYWRPAHFDGVVQESAEVGWHALVVTRVE